jgi:hypothetical protein
MSVILAALLAISPAQQTAVKSYFDANLLDMPSARWKWPAVSEKKPMIYCGWVNAKNRMGAYTGWQPFYVVFENKKIKQGRLWDNGKNDIMVEAFCGDAGYNYTTPPRDTD